MQYVLAALIVLGAWHYLYENIVLPTVHTSFRNKLFALRDELRGHLIDRPEIDKAAFEVAHDGINNAINCVDVIDLSMQMRVQHLMSTDADFRARVDARRKLVDETSSTEIKDIVKRANEMLRDVFVLNSGGWFVYVVPIVIAIVFSRKIMVTTKEVFTLAAKDAERMLGLQAATC
jgi:hypothetical protein